MDASLRRRWFLPVLALASISLLAPHASVAQATAGSRQAVAYVDVMPPRSGDAARAFRQYREGAAREDGFASLDVFEQIGRPGHFAVVSTWRDQGAYDAHHAGPAFARLQEALAPLRTTGYDVRGYRPLAVGAVRPVRRDAVAVVTHVDIGGGAKVDAAALLRTLADASRAEPANLRFDVTQNPSRLNHFTIVEIWEDENALDRHAAQAHTKRFREEVQPASGSPIDERTYRRVE